MLKSYPPKPDLIAAEQSTKWTWPQPWLQNDTTIDLRIPRTYLRDLPESTVKNLLNFALWEETSTECYT